MGLLAGLFGAGGGAAGGMGAFGGLGGMGMGGQMPDMNAMLQIMQTPGYSQAMSEMLSNPQMLEQMVQMNPQLRAAMDSNPQAR